MHTLDIQTLSQPPAPCQGLTRRMGLVHISKPLSLVMKDIYRSGHVVFMLALEFYGTHGKMSKRKWVNEAMKIQDAQKKFLEGLER